MELYSFRNWCLFPNKIRCRIKRSVCSNEMQNIKLPTPMSKLAMESIQQLTLISIVLCIPAVRADVVLCMYSNNTMHV